MVRNICRIVLDLRIIRKPYEVFKTRTMMYTTHGETLRYCNIDLPDPSFPHKRCNAHVPIPACRISSAAAKMYISLS